MIVLATSAPASAVASPEPEPLGQIIITHSAARFAAYYHVNDVGSISAIDFSIQAQLADEHGGGGFVASLVNVKLEIIFPDDFGGTTPRWGFNGQLGIGTQPWIFDSDVFDPEAHTTTVIFFFRDVPVGPAGQMQLLGLFIETSEAARGTTATYTITGVDTEGRTLVTPGSITAFEDPSDDT